MSLKSKISAFIKKNKFYISLGVICILLFAIYKNSRRPLVTPIDNRALLQEVQHLKDRNGRDFAKLETEIIGKKQAIERADSLARLLRLKPRQIKGTDVYITRTDTVFANLPAEVIIRVKDTAYSVRKKDNYVDITATAGRLGGSIHYSSIDTLTRTEVVKNPLFGRTKRYITLQNANPYNKITHGYSWETKEKKTWLSVGPSIQYNPFNSKVSVGVSAQIPIISFKK